MKDLKVDDTSTFGSCEGFIAVSFKKEGVKLRLICAYTEPQRDNFKIDEAAFVSGVLNRESRSSRAAMTQPGSPGTQAKAKPTSRPPGICLDPEEVALLLLGTFSSNSPLRH